MHKLLKNTVIKGLIFYNVRGGAQGLPEKCGVIKTLPPPQIITDENCTPLGNTPPPPIFAVISKVQCQRQKRIKE